MLEMAHNGDLLDYINYRRGLPEPQARFVLRSIASGISHCHVRGIVHRDLKCENIMLTRDMEVKIGGKDYKISTRSYLLSSKLNFEDRVCVSISSFSVILCHQVFNNSTWRTECCI